MLQPRVPYTFYTGGVHPSALASQPENVLFCSLAVLDPRVGHTIDYFLHLSLSSVHVLMLSIQAVRGLPRLRAPGIVPCIISFSRQLPSFLVAPYSFLGLTVSNSSVFTPALLRTHSFVFFAVHETRRIFLSSFISKASRRFSIHPESPPLTTVRCCRPH